MIKDLPEKLKLLRVKYGYSQKQVADKVNISPSIISGYCSFVNDVRPKKSERVASFADRFC